MINRTSLIIFSPILYLLLLIIGTYFNFYIFLVILAFSSSLFFVCFYILANYHSNAGELDQWMFAAGILNLLIYSWIYWFKPLIDKFAGDSPQ